ncbi:MAG: glycine cleavage system aminomethyltransferase GcvT [Candidatus Omnitrophica bacterium]|nr:glycine cleavage system aminomethyltransferase GcvT [Candidatus Omnitrophota bacterium]
MTEQIKKTPLYDRHMRLGAKMVEFGGFLMPIQYTNITEEHLATRTHAGLFDISHMGELLVTGKNAEDFLSRLLTGEVRSLADGKTLYTLLCNERGGIVDDLMVYRMSRERWMLVVNAANIQKDYRWLKAHLRGSDVQLADLSSAIALVALQGPQAEPMLRKSPYPQASDLKRNSFLECEANGEKILISRTGYTGEDGFEIYVSSQFSIEVWETLLLIGEGSGLKPVGLAARDTLRLESCLPLYGHELDDETTPYEAGLDWTVSLGKSDFIGKDSLLQQKKEGTKRRLIGFEMLEQGIPRQGCVIWKEQGIGKVTSGTHSPFLQKTIGLGYVPPAASETGTALFVEIREKKLRAKVVGTPFYKRSRS